MPRGKRMPGLPRFFADSRSVRSSQQSLVTAKYEDFARTQRENTQPTPPPWGRPPSAVHAAQPHRAALPLPSVLSTVPISSHSEERSDEEPAVSSKRPET